MSWGKSTTIVQAIAAGSPAAEEEFSRRFLPRLGAFFRARVADPGRIDDLTQETALASLRALRDGRLRDAEALDSFVLGVARRHWAEGCRHDSRTRTSPLDEEGEAVLPVTTERPEWTLSVRREFQTLDPVNRRILWLILVEGYRPDEVAPLVGLSSDVVRQRKFRALKKMAQNLGLAAVTNRLWETTNHVKGQER